MKSTRPERFPLWITTWEDEVLECMIKNAPHPWTIHGQCAETETWEFSVSISSLSSPPSWYGKSSCSRAFDVIKFFQEWQGSLSKNLHRGHPHSSVHGLTPSLPRLFPPLFLYSPLVTSTQTLLESSSLFANLLFSFWKDPSLSVIPRPAFLVFVADEQTKGKGRSQNQWISSQGCLQFSIVTMFPHPLYTGWGGNPPFDQVSTHLIFLQYVFSLAILQTLCTQFPQLPVHLKWPNDVYALLPENQVMNTCPSPEMRMENAQKQWVKMAGVLVHSKRVYTHPEEKHMYPDHGRSQVILGCGINLFPPTPTISVSELLQDDTKVSKEMTLVCILHVLHSHLALFHADMSRMDEPHTHISMEEMSSLSFGLSTYSFMPFYYAHWLHSRQLLTLPNRISSLSPPVQLRVMGISTRGYLLTQNSCTQEWQELSPTNYSLDIVEQVLRERN